MSEISQEEEIQNLEGMSIFRFHVRINGNRTTISLDPSLFRALTFKLGSSTSAKRWLSDKAMDMTKTNKSISRQLQGLLTLFLMDMECKGDLEKYQDKGLAERKATASANILSGSSSTKPATFQSDALPT